MMPGMHPLTILLVLIVLILALEVVEIMIVRWRSEKKEIELAFPFRDGKYVITDGGNSKTSRLMNYHYYSPIHRKNHTNNSMMFAANIVKLERGRGGNGFLPKRLEGYHIWREEIHSPMSGKIIKVIDDIPDNEPFCGKYPYNAGNTVVIQKENKFLLLGHMRRGSMRVREGEMVEANHIIGEVGSSGMSERPHLHMQLMTSDSGNYWSGMGVSIQYRGINLYKNRIVEM
jgi:hypothetical protein